MNMLVLLFFDRRYFFGLKVFKVFQVFFLFLFFGSKRKPFRNKGGVDRETYRVF